MFNPACASGSGTCSRRDMICRVQSPALLYVPGLGSKMDGRKATALETHAAQKGYNCIRYEPRAPATVPSDLSHFCFTDLLQDAEAALVEVGKNRPTVIVGASIGAWIGLLLARRHPTTVLGLVLIAAAVDVTEEWRQHAEQQLGQPLPLEATFYLPSQYAEGGAYQMSARFIATAVPHLLLLGSTPKVDVMQPVRIMHGALDLEVPPERSLRLLNCLEGPDTLLVVTEGGDHRLSRPADIQLLLRLVDDVMDASIGG
eukprot:jgi/Botrbrau1/12251/Bobra.0361s0013.1